jgi:arylsulfatase A-like enzyme
MRTNGFSLAWLWLAAVALALGCGDRAFRLTEISGDLDATHVVVDLADRVASAEFLRESAFIELGSPDSARAMVSGWGEPEVKSRTGEPFAWATAKTAVLEMMLFRTDLRELHIRGRAYHWSGAPEQRVAIHINGRQVGAVGLAQKSSDVSVPVPEGVLRVGDNRVELHFSRIDRPVDREKESTDDRALAAAFQWVALTDGGSPQRAGVGEEPPSSEGGDMTLNPGTGVRFRVAMPDSGVLDLGMSAQPSETSALLGKVWAARQGEQAQNVVTLDPTVLAGGRARLEIPSTPGEIIEISLAAAGSGPPGASLTFHRPRILSRESAVGGEEIASVLLIVVDTLRADYLGVYGSSNHTPVVDGLASRGVLFTKARSHIPITGPSHASLFTSRLPMEHGVRNNAQEFPTGFMTMAEAMQAAGRRTAAVISLGVLQGYFGFERGFDSYGDDFPRDWMKDAVEVTDELLALAGNSLSEPFFLWAHYADPHEPYAPIGLDYPKFDIRIDGDSVGTFDARGRGFWFDVEVPAGDSELAFVPIGNEPGPVYRIDNLRFEDEFVLFEPLDGWEVINRRMGRTTFQSTFPATLRLSNPSTTPTDTRLFVSCKQLLDQPEIREAYAREVEIVDREIGRLLDGLEARGMMDNTLVIFLSDHGEGLGDHNHIGHISQVYDSLLHVPLVFSWPGSLPEGMVIEDPVSLIDVFPTVADLLGLASPPDASGVSVTPLLRGEALPPRPIIAVTYRPESYSDKRAIIADGFKFIHSWKDDRTWEELYDVVNDPGELDDLFKTEPETADGMRAKLQRHLAELSETASIDAELSEEDKAHLEALGYIH